ncbi:MAG: hypothetical protein MK102_02580 [Fuerstiella sp.]|nr:hypothetical protein [Fuerstiella sp.]
MTGFASPTFFVSSLCENGAEAKLVLVPEFADREGRGASYLTLRNREIQVQIRNWSILLTAIGSASTTTGNLVTKVWRFLFPRMTD